MLREDTFLFLFLCSVYLSLPKRLLFTINLDGQMLQITNLRRYNSSGCVLWTVLEIGEGEWGAEL